MPFAVGPCLHPRVVVVGMRPSGRVYLACGYSHRAERRHCEGRFLAAAAQSRAHGGERRIGTCVRRTVCGLLMAPVVHFEYRLTHRKTLHTVLKLFVHCRTREIEILVIYTHRQHEMAPFPLWHRAAPRHLARGAQRRPYVGQIERRIVVGNIGQRHIGIQPPQGIFLVATHGVGRKHRGHIASLAATVSPAVGVL